MNGSESKDESGAEVPDPPPDSQSDSYDSLAGYSFDLCCANVIGLFTINDFIYERRFVSS